MREDVHHDHAAGVQSKGRSRAFADLQVVRVAVHAACVMAGRVKTRDHVVVLVKGGSINWLFWEPSPIG